jgi:hypothetical protein
MKTYNDYPKAASENAQRALDWAEKNGWGSCGTPVGKKRANQLAKGESISRDTIARMAAFERHRGSSKRALGEGCGRLMWLAWGGDAGVAWAQRKLKQIDKEKLKSISNIRKYNKPSGESEMIALFKTIKGEKFTDFGLTLEEILKPEYFQEVSDDENLLKLADIPEGYEVRYKYVGPEDDKNRPFCKEMLTTYRETWWSRSDIETLNVAPGKADRKGGKPYSVFNWRGGNFCRHKFVRYYFNPTTGDVFKTPVQPAQKSTLPK